MDFRFTREQLKILVVELGLSGVMVQLDNGIRMPGEEILLRGLYELTSGEVQNRIAKEFERDWTAQSRAFKAFIDIIFDNFFSSRVSLYAEDYMYVHEQSAHILEKLSPINQSKNGRIVTRKTDEYSF